MSEETPAPRVSKPHATRRVSGPENPPPLLDRRLKLYLVIGSLVGVALTLAVALVVRDGSGPVSPPVEPVAKAPPVGTPKIGVTRPPARTPAGRMNELLEREKATPRAFRTLYDAWGELLKDAPPGLRPEILEQMERLQAAATKEYRTLYHPVNENVRELLGARQPREAQKVLEQFRIPGEIDVTGDHAADVKRQLARIADLITFEEQRSRLLADYRKGEFAADAASTIGPWLKAEELHVRIEAENALAELKLIRALGLLKQKFEGRRAAAQARVEEARRQIGIDAAAEKARTAAWEARLKDRTQKKPLSLQQLGVKDMNVALRVSKYNGRTVSLAGEGMELTLSMDELPTEVYGRLITDAPDPTKAAELIEAGKLAVRQNALIAAKALFDQAIKVDRSVADLVPDLGRLGAGIGTFRGQTDLKGDTLALRYDFQSPDHLKDFKVEADVVATSGGGVLSLTGERLFTLTPGELKFSGRIRISADPRSINGSAGYIVGVASEVVPGDLDLFVVLVQPGRGYRTLRLNHKGDEQILGEGPIEGPGGLIEVGVDGGRAELRVGGVNAWTGSLPEFTTLRPAIGGVGFGEGKVEVSYRSLKFEGRASPDWIRRLQSERLTVLEAKLSKERRATKQELAATHLQGERSFGDGRMAPLPLEAELRDVIPARVAASYAVARKSLGLLEKAKTDQAISRLWRLVDQNLEEAIREAPWLPLTRYYRAEWRFLEGDHAGAMSDLLEATANQQGFVEARVARAELLVEDGKYAEAEKELDGSLTMVPDLARARLTRALLHYYAGREADAVAELEVARRLEPGDLYMVRSAKRLRNIVTGPRWSGTVAVDTPHYLIRAESPKLAKKGKKDDSEQAVRERTHRYADHLSAARTYFAQLVPGSEARPRKPLVYICDTPESYYVYADFTSEDRLEHTSGVYLGEYQQLLFFRAETEQDTLETMTHEAFHEYLQAVMPAAPIWLNEGLAEYAAGAKIQGGRVTSVGGIIQGRLRDLKAALEAGWPGFPFEFVLWETQEHFYSLAPELQYAQVWSMIHFFMHAKGGKYKPLLERYMKTLMETRSTSEAREIFTSTDLAVLEREWLSYVRALR